MEHGSRCRSRFACSEHMRPCVATALLALQPNNQPGDTCRSNTCAAVPHPPFARPQLLLLPNLRRLVLWNTLYSTDSMAGLSRLSSLTALASECCLHLPRPASLAALTGEAGQGTLAHRSPAAHLLHLAWGGAPGASSPPLPLRLLSVQAASHEQPTHCLTMPHLCRAAASASRIFPHKAGGCAGALHRFAGAAAAGMPVAGAHATAPSSTLGLSGVSVSAAPRFADVEAGKSPSAGAAAAPRPALPGHQLAHRRCQPASVSGHAGAGGSVAA